MQYNLHNILNHISSENSYKKSVLYIPKQKNNNKFIKKLLDVALFAGVEETNNQWKITLTTDSNARPIIKDVWVPKTAQPVFFTYKKLITFLKTSLFPYRPFQTLKSTKSTNLYTENHTAPSIVLLFVTPNGVYSQYEMLQKQIGGILIGLIYT